AAPHLEAVALAGNLALVGRVRVQHHPARAAGLAPAHAVGGDQRVLHPRGHLRALAQHADIADRAGAAAMEAGAAGVRTNGVALDAQREIALDVLDRIVLLGDVVDHVDAVGEGAGAEPHAEPLDAEDRALTDFVPAAEV